MQLKPLTRCGLKDIQSKWSNSSSFLPPQIFPPIQKNIGSGVAQVSVILPVLYNTFVSFLPTSPPTNMTAQYANNTTILFRSHHLRIINHGIQFHLVDIEELCANQEVLSHKQRNVTTTVLRFQSSMEVPSHRKHSRSRYSVDSTSQTSSLSKTIRKVQVQIARSGVCVFI